MKIKFQNILSILVISSYMILGQSWKSERVYFGNDGKLVYTLDSESNRIPDFSYAGYKNSEQPIPTVAVVKTITPVNGDNTANIQNAINEVGKLQLVNGIRGALLLKAGKYEVNGSININFSGVVLRGEGDGENASSNTIIFGKGNVPNQRTLIIAGGGSRTKWGGQISGTNTNIISQKVYVGEKSFQVQNPIPFNVGDNIIIVHPNSNVWLQAVDYGAPATDPNWTTSDQLTILYNRYIKNINGDIITVDAPVFNTLDKNLSQSYIYKCDIGGLLTNIGIENLRVDIEILGANSSPTNQNGDEAHIWEAVELIQLEDSWVKDCTMIHFGHSGIMTSTASRITIDNCKAIDPVSIITGERRYNFNMYHASQLILVKNCYTRYGRHDYVSNGTTTVSGCVFYNCVSEGIYNASEGHRWWSQGLLYDNVTFNNPNTSFVLGLYNRGDYGTSHGWASAHSVAWHCIANGGKKIIIQKPPTAQNYAIGCTAGEVTGISPPAPFNHTQGFIEGTGQSNINPVSLFIAQLTERMNNLTNVNNERLSVLPFILEQNYPNPFNPDTKIRYTLNTSGDVKINLYDILGRKVRSIFSGFQNEGSYTIIVSLKNLCSGVYIYELAHNGKVLRKKMQLIK